MNYKLLAFDLDGTLTNSEKIITPATKEALKKAREDGAMIALASGRPVYGIMPLAKELELDVYGGYILAYNGGCMVDCKTMEVVYDKKVPEDMVRAVCQYAKKNGFAILSYEGDMIIASKHNEYVEEESRITGLPVKVVDDMETYIDFPINKFLLVEDPKVILSHLEEVAQLFPVLNVFRSAPFFMEIVPPQVDKAEALAFLLEKIGVKKEQLAAFGDGDNDATMLAFAGCGVAMENAGEKCKSVANVMTRSNDEDGIAYALNELL